jgi:hypothetical protein
VGGPVAAVIADALVEICLGRLKLVEGYAELHRSRQVLVTKPPGAPLELDFFGPSSFAAGTPDTHIRVEVLNGHPFDLSVGLARVTHEGDPGDKAPRPIVHVSDERLELPRPIQACVCLAVTLAASEAVDARS